MTEVMEIPEVLVSQIRQGRVVLLLGSWGVPSMLAVTVVQRERTRARR